MIERAQRFLDARKNRGAIERHFFVLRAAAIGDHSRERSFIESRSGKSQREAANAGMRAARQHGDGAGIESARKKKAHGNIGDEVRFDGVL